MKVMKLSEIAKIYRGIPASNPFIQNGDFIILPYYKSYRFLQIQQPCILLTDDLIPIPYPSSNLPHNILYSIHSDKLDQIKEYLKTHNMNLKGKEIKEIEIEIHEE